MANAMGMAALLVLSVLVALSGARPQNHREVKLITQPRPGQEYVMIQSGLFKPQKQTEQPEQAFVTSHKIPGKIPEDDPEDLIVKKIKRESEILPEDEAVDFLLTPDQTLALPAETAEREPKTSDKVEVRTEYSVVTSKPRKGSKAIAFAAKESQSVPVLSPTAQVPLPEVDVESKGETGKLEAALSGDDEKKVMQKKLSAVEHVTKVPVKDEPTLKQVEVKVASELGVSSPKVVEEEGAITVPLQKKQVVSPHVEEQPPAPPSTLAPPGYEILPVNILPKTAEKVKNKEKDFDFVDSPLADKVLVPAGSNQNQQSRIEVKKGPNGQDYEYEYVYYYYDDDENDASGGTGTKKTAGGKGSTATPETTTSSRHYLPKKESEDTPASSTRARTRGQTAAPSEEKHEADKAAGKTRYSSVERTTTAAPDTANEVLPTRGAGARTRGRTLTTEEPAVSDERLPVNTRFPPRSRSNHNSNSPKMTRGRTLTTEEPAVSDERLPVNTRFPPRSRSNHNSNSLASTTALPQDTPTRGRGSNSSVRRPSLELVDSSSFKTQSSDASRDQDPRPEFPKTLPAANEEEVVKPRGRGRGQTSATPATPAPVNEEQEEEDSEDTSVESHSRGQLSRRPDTAVRTRGQAAEEDEDEDEVSIPQSVTEMPEEDQSLTTVTDAEVGLTAAAMDKAALELYAVLSQARAESNSIDEESTDLTTDEDTTELDDLSTTPEPTTEAPTTTTTTTTTPAPTTTTTTTTEAPAPGGRGRYRQRGGNGGRNRFRAGDSSTTTTTEIPAETSTKARARFGANRASTPRRSGFTKPSPARSEEESVEHEAQKEESKPDNAGPAHPRPGGFSRNRFGAPRTPKVTTPATTAAASSDDSQAAAAPANKPVFADRFNLRRRGGLKLSTTASPAAEETKADNGEETNEPPAEPSTTVAPGGRLPGRSRLSVGSGPRPLRPGPRVNIASRGRLGATTTTTSAPSTEAEDTAIEQSSAVSQEEPQSEEAQEVVTTPAPDALTRLRNRPRLRVNNAKPTPTPTPAPIRRSPLISRRKLGAQPAEVKESAETDSQDASSEDTPASSEETSEGGGEEASSSAPTEPEQPQGLASLVSGRRRGNALRRPRTLLPSSRVAAKAS